jgi:hypothetical protein
MPLLAEAITCILHEHDINPARMRAMAQRLPAESQKAALCCAPVAGPVADTASTDGAVAEAVAKRTPDAIRQSGGRCSAGCGTTKRTQAKNAVASAPLSSKQAVTGSCWTTPMYAWHCQAFAY